MEGGAKRTGENKAGRGQGGNGLTQKEMELRCLPWGQGQGESGSRGSKETDVAGTAEQGRAAGLRGAEWCWARNGRKQTGRKGSQSPLRPPSWVTSSFLQWGQDPAPHPFLLLPDPCGSPRLTQDLSGHSDRWGWTGTQPGY